MKYSKYEYRKVLEMARGLSLGICLPKQLTTQLSLGAGDFVKVHQEEDRIIIERAS